MCCEDVLQREEIFGRGKGWGDWRDRGGEGVKTGGTLVGRGQTEGHGQGGMSYYGRNNNLGSKDSHWLSCR